jgi:superfamily II DNA/RNA helicase
MKFLQLQELLNKEELEKVLIFAETKREVEKLTKDLIIEGFKAESIHGDKRQGQRQQALKLFKQDFVDILVANDVAARGLDINDVSHVINYTVPQTYNDYIHRIGRTGRGNKKGHALTFVDAR